MGMGLFAQPHDSTLHYDAQDRLLQLRRVLEALTLRMRVDGLDLPSQLGLHNRELSILARVVLAGPLSLKELVADLDIPPSSMTTLVDRLEASGFARRIPSAVDRRLVVLEATSTAADALEASMAGFTRVAARMFDVLSEGEQEQLLLLLGRMADRF